MMQHASPFGLLAPGATGVIGYFNKMVADLESNPEKYGFRGAKRFVATGDASRINEICTVFYFDSQEALLKWSHDAVHMKGWLWWNGVHKKYPHLGLYVLTHSPLATTLLIDGLTGCTNCMMLHLEIGKLHTSTTNQAGSEQLPTLLETRKTRLCGHRRLLSRIKRIEAPLEGWADLTERTTRRERVSRFQECMQRED